MVTASNSVAVLVGVSSFEDPALTTLRFCSNDVDDLAKALSDPGIATFDVTKLHEPDRDTILHTLDDMASRLGPDDKFLFYYAGHGRRSSGGKLYLAARNTRADKLRVSAVPIDQALEIMQESRCSQRVMILDCCHSGAVGSEFRGHVADDLQELARSRGTCILAASTGVQLAEEREAVGETGKGNGIFTRHLVEGLETGLAAGNSDYVTVDSLYDYAFRKVVTTSSQTPMKWVIGGVGSIIIGKSIAGGWQTNRSAIQVQFRELHNQRLIPGAFLDMVEEISRKDWLSLNESERQFGQKLILFSRREITLFDIVSEQVRSSNFFAANAAGQPEPGAVGSNWAVVGDSPGVTSFFWSLLKFGIVPFGFLLSLIFLLARFH